jgi:hypothetical protein
MPRNARKRIPLNQLEILTVACRVVSNAAKSRKYLRIDRKSCLGDNSSGGSTEEQLTREISEQARLGGHESRADTGSRRG